ncbi:MAG: uracil-DNA glycosylase, partial [Dehalococcoidia bacterium]|nr:uracil-DNA glycosylase [Dehalococcoidia bacterium]
DGVPVPPSLLNIYKEIESDLEIKVRKNTGNLERWSKQGVMLLNTTLTVERSKPMSHKDFGWSLFTDKVIHILSENKKNLVFFLWGSHAKSKINLIDTDKHLVIESSHPSPLSVYRGFLGSRPFSKANNYLVENKLKAIDWA